MVYVLLAEGFEEIEALAPIDIMRRAGLNVVTVSVGSKKEVTGAHGICVTADALIDGIKNTDGARLIMLPGGMPGTKNLDASSAVHAILDEAEENGVRVAAICAAPMILGKRGALRGKRAICYPGFEQYLEGAEIADEKVVTDENITTGKGAGAAVEFGLELVTLLCGKETADGIKNGIFA